MNTLIVSAAATLFAAMSSQGFEAHNKFRTWGECVSAYSQQRTDDWKDAGGPDATAKGKSDFEPLFWCVKSGDDQWILVAYPG